jgi:DNA-binding response OmpR family regulator
MTKKILIVEDDEPIRQSMKELLEDEGYHVSCAHNGQVALESLLADKNLPDLILLDLMMPVKDGKQFCLDQAACHWIAQIPVVIMSASSNIKIETMPPQVKGLIEKPADIDQIIKTIKEHCL